MYRIEVLGHPPWSHSHCHHHNAYSYYIARNVAHLVLEALDVQHQDVRESVDPQMLRGAGLVLALLAVECLLALR